MSGYGASAPLDTGGGAAALGYSLITGWGAINDAASAADTGSGMVNGTGTIVTKAADATARIGYQTDWTGWDIPLLTLFPSWDDRYDRLDLLLEVAALPLTTAKWGWCAWVQDNTYANRATMAAKGVFVFPNSTTIFQCGEVGALGNGVANNNGTNTNPVTHLYSSTTFDATGVPRVIGRARRSLPDEQEINVVQTPPAALAAAANRRIALATTHQAAVGGAVTLSARLYARRIRTTGFFA